ncbi:MAG TPA: ATP-binding protein [Symbiobacteriaceae bacterium]|jgi:signal transduction histidine kinase|nr:ATP-binding protein [Symbiobacteriaceae bacterium]
MLRRKLSVQFMIGITLTLLLMLGSNLVLLWRQQQHDLQLEMHSKAKVMTQELIATRLFIARNQDRINRDPKSGHIEFKGLNPAAVGRGVGTIFNEITGFEVKQTRFEVRRPENEPDTFDREALTRFLQDPDLPEYFRRVDDEAGPTFRYAVPLRTEKECLVCHGQPVGEIDIAGYRKEGLQEGDLAGAISVKVPMAESIARIQHNTMVQLWVVVGITGASLVVIFLLSRGLVTIPLGRLAKVARRIGRGNLEIAPHDLELLRRSEELGVVADNMDAMARSLQELYTSLEEKVADRTRELAQANKVQAQFLATVSHELRTPLTSIIAFTELLIKRSDGQNREYLEDVLESSRRLLDMVNDLLDLSRLEAGRVQLFQDFLDLPELIIQVERSVRPLADRKHITLQLNLPGDLPPVLIDPLRIKQVLLNLLSNAIKFTPESGTVTVHAAKTGEAIEVMIQDSGPGVPPEQRKLIFEAFRRLEVPGNQHPGSGLGLALARNLVELHGGQIWVDDAPGGGSQFHFTLPAALAAKEEEFADGDD